MHEHEQSLLGRITPWVGRILALNAVVLLLMETLFTSPAITNWLSFNPALAFNRPWTFLTYMVVHGGLFHLAANSLALFVFGPAVERRLGSAAFLTYYIYCGLGAAILSLVLATMMPIAPFIGASGAILGIAVAYAKFFPDSELIIFPLPMPIRARTLVWLLVGLDLVGTMLGSTDGIAHIAHLGGVLAGLLYFAIQRMTHPDQGPPLPPMRPQISPVSVVWGGGGDSGEQSGTSGHRTAAAVQPPKPQVDDSAERESAELDRLLDKINTAGLSSLTHEERAFLDEASRRRRDHSD